MKTYYAIGLMSGTSMDGVDIAYAKFTETQNNWNFEILAANCVEYSPQWLSRLVKLPEQSAEIFGKTNVFYGKYLGQVVNQFIKENKLEGKVDLISSHGQTVFHNPQKAYTVQIGSGAEITAATGIPTVCDLRTSDVALGGQGAPIVPLGEKFLFPEYQCFINIGGISNISFHQTDTVIGYDVCMGNLLLDHFAHQLGKTYDAGGEIARSGTVDTALLAHLNENKFFKKQPPKSLDATEILEENLPLIPTGTLAVTDIMATVVEHVAIQLSADINQSKVKKVLLTGGGGFNTFLVERLQAHSYAEIVVPTLKVVEFKEALIMAFLGLKRVLRQPNVLASVTGARRDSINGAIYL